VSVRQSLLALLAQGPRHGARIKAEFESQTGGPLNVGQVYTTLARLERDGLVVGDGRPDDEGRIAYHLTDAGRLEVARWWTEAVDRDEPGRDELLIKLALALADPQVDSLSVIQAQRTATMRTLQQLTRRKIALDASTDTSTDAMLAARLVLEHRLFSVEAELRWLDQAEALLVRRARGIPMTPGGGQPSPPPADPTTGAPS
jgi:DNA-binding PadR family transcriptional regulator